MATTSYDVIVNRVASEVPVCPDFFIKDRVQEVAQDYFRKTQAWRIDLDVQSAIGKLTEYDIDTPSNTRVAEVLWVNYETVTLIPKTEKQLNLISTDWRTRLGRPIYYTMITPVTFAVSPVPEITVQNAISVRAAIYPTMTAKGIDSVIFDDNYSALLHGTLASVLTSSKKEWTDINAGMLYQQTYTDELLKKSAYMNDSMVKPFRKAKYGGL